MCRKAHAAPFATFTSSSAKAFEWLSGGERIGQYESSPGRIRSFCTGCGSSLPGTVPDGHRVLIPAGCFDDDPGLRGGAHVFVGSQASWHMIAHGLERHGAGSAGPGEGGLPGSMNPVRAGRPNGALRGSCLCGSVTFEVNQRFSAIHKLPLFAVPQSQSRGPYDQRLRIVRRFAFHKRRASGHRVQAPRREELRSGVLLGMRLGDAAPKRLGRHGQRAPGRS
jgi:hypothetical protein